MLKEILHGTFGIETILETYKNKKILITGHTGFKGSWLTLWLSMIGVKLYGISLKPKRFDDHFNFIKTDIESHYLDLRDYTKIKKIVKKINPDLIFHLAAQPLVRESYLSPLETWNINVMGTANILDAARCCEKLRGLVVVTSDKCYENIEIQRGYKESDPMGGHDPYSSSKGACELLVNSFRNSFFASSKQLIASARAGNVIGGGDWSEDRLVPDIARAVKSNSNIVIRSPEATRPWQHVLDCLNGYLLLGESLLKRKKEFAQAWNFGPNKSGNLKVIDVIKIIAAEWEGVNYEIQKSVDLHEANLLFLNNTKVKKYLNWKPVWGVKRSIVETIEWYKVFHEKHQIISEDQIKKFMMDCTS